MLTRSCPTHFMELDKAEDLGRQIKPVISFKKTGQVILVGLFRKCHYFPNFLRMGS